MSLHGMRGDVVSNCSHWTDKETRHLIKIWRQPNILADIRDLSSRQKTVYKRIAKLIAAEGYHRDESQVRNKIRTMTTNFRKLMKMKDRSNWTGQGKHTFLYFNELREFLDADVPGGSFSTCASESAGEATAGGQDGDSPNSPTAQAQPLQIQQLGTIKLENNRERVPTTAAFDGTSLSNDGASLLNTSGTPNHQLHQFSSDEEFDDIDSSRGIQVHPVTEAGWICDEDEIDCEKPRAKLRSHFDLRHHPGKQKRERTRNTKKDETVKHLVKTLMENNMQRDKVLMEAEDAHRRMEADRHTEEIRLLRDQIQLDRDRLQFEREERERMELIRKEEAARSERLRREEMERTEKARLDERDREERRFELMMALIKGAQNHSN